MENRKSATILKRMIQDLEAACAELEAEWDRLDSQGGTGHQRQITIANDLERMARELNTYAKLLAKLAGEK